MGGSRDGTFFNPGLKTVYMVGGMGTGYRVYMRILPDTVKFYRIFRFLRLMKLV